MSEEQLSTIISLSLVEIDHLLSDALQLHVFNQQV